MRFALVQVCIGAGKYFEYSVAGMLASVRTEEFESMDLRTSSGGRWARTRLVALEAGDRELRGVRGFTRHDVEETYPKDMVDVFVVLVDCSMQIAVSCCFELVVSSSPCMETRAPFMLLSH
jgi:hypothetical protein